MDYVLFYIFKIDIWSLQRQFSEIVTYYKTREVIICANANIVSDEGVAYMCKCKHSIRHGSGLYVRMQL